VAEPAVVDLVWPALPLDAATYAGVHALVAAVAATGGAVGWLEVPPERESRDWLDGVLASGGRLVLATRGNSVAGCGYWQHLTAPVMRQNAEIRKVMVAPDARGLGIARRVLVALVRDADRTGVEVLSLGSRGNNHAALGLYTSLGFVVTGRRPDSIAVGQDRFDEVLLHLDLRPGRDPTGPPLVRHGSRREGPGRT